jgi:peptide subunit release factor 1 (eRF1)
MPPKLATQSEASNSSSLKIPRKDVVKFVIKEALQKRKAMSQKELAEIITKELRRGESKYRITGRRARLLALEVPVKIKTETRKGRVPRKCPVCSRGLKRTYSKNLYGKKLLTSLKCSRCGYHGAGGKWMPRKYRFSIN